MTREQLEEIRKAYDALDDKGPWRWEQVYEMGERDFRWGLCSDKSNANRSVVDCYSITAADYPKAMGGKPVGETDYMLFMAKSAERIKLMLDYISTLETDCRKALCYDHVKAEQYEKAERLRETKWHELSVEALRKHVELLDKVQPKEPKE